MAQGKAPKVTAGLSFSFLPLACAQHSVPLGRGRVKASAQLWGRRRRSGGGTGCGDLQDETQLDETQLGVEGGRRYRTEAAPSSSQGSHRAGLVWVRVH